MRVSDILLVRGKILRYWSAACWSSMRFFESFTMLCRCPVSWERVSRNSGRLVCMSWFSAYCICLQPTWGVVILRNLLPLGRVMVRSHVGAFWRVLACLRFWHLMCAIEALWNCRGPLCLGSQSCCTIL